MDVAPEAALTCGAVSTKDGNDSKGRLPEHEVVTGLSNKGMKLTNLAAAPELCRRRRGVRLAGMERTGSQLIPGVRRTRVER